MPLLTLRDAGVRNDAMEWQIGNDGDSPIPETTVLCEWWVFDRNDLTNFVVQTHTYRTDSDIAAGDCASFSENLVGWITADGNHTSVLKVNRETSTYDFDIVGVGPTPCRRRYGLGTTRPSGVTR